MYHTPPGRVAIYVVDMTDADTEYSQLLPDNTKAVTVQCRDNTAFRMAFETGKVATPTDPYFTVKAGAAFYENRVNFASKTIYLASASAGKTIEIICWYGG